MLKAEFFGADVESSTCDNSVLIVLGATSSPVFFFHTSLRRTRSASGWSPQSLSGGSAKDQRVLAATVTPQEYESEAPQRCCSLSTGVRRRIAAPVEVWLSPVLSFLRNKGTKKVRMIFFNTLWSLTDDYCSWIPAVHIVPALQNTTVTGKKQLYSSCARWLHKAGSCTTSFSSKRSVMHSVHLSHSLQLAERQCWKPRRRACVWRASFTVPPQARVVTQSCQLCASVFAEVKRKANYHLVLHFH